MRAFPLASLVALLLAAPLLGSPALATLPPPGCPPAPVIRNTAEAGIVGPELDYVDATVSPVTYDLQASDGQARLTVLSYVQNPDGTFQCNLACANTTNGLTRTAVCTVPPGFHMVEVSYVWATSGSVAFAMLGWCGNPQNGPC